MRAGERAALAALSLTLNPAPTPDDVWRPSPYNVPELHERVVAEILADVGRARHEENVTPLTVAMQGRAGSGKTHLLGAVRERIQDNGGYFFLISLINGKTFWESTALCIVEGLGQPAPGWSSQLKSFHRRIGAQLGLPTDVRDAIAGDAALTREHLDAYIFALRTHDPAIGRDCQDTARALVLNGSRSFDVQDIGYAHLISEVGEPAGRQEWGLSAAVRQSQLIVRDISRLIATTLSPTVIAIDQIDTLFAQARANFLQHNGREEESAAVVAPVADGILNLREITRRTLTVVSCLPDTWELLKRYASGPTLERIRLAILPDRIPTADIGRAIITKRFAAGFAAKLVKAPHATRPIADQAFADVTDFSPRRLLIAADRHIRRCLDADALNELTRIEDALHEGYVLGGCGDNLGTTKHLDERFAELVATADITAALDHTTEDKAMPVLIAAGLSAWIDERVPTGATYKHDPLPGAKPALHGRLIEVLDEATENEAHWGFRAIGSSHAVAVISRVKAACTKIGLDLSMPQRKLVLLRNQPWPRGPRTTEILEAFRAAGGIERAVSEADLKVLEALRRMREEADPLFPDWLAARKPASALAFLRDVLGTQSPPII